MRKSAARRNGHVKDAQLEKMSVAELVDLKDRFDAMVAAKQERERIELRERFDKMAREAGLSLNEVIGGRGKAGRGKSGGAVRFRHPDNASLTWSGRGRKPKWLVEAGGDAERFRVR